MPNTMLRLWENYTPRKSDQLTNVGASWVIDPTGPIVKPTECINATSAPGILKIYRDFHPDCLVIHWMFPNVHVGHVLWVSQAPTHLTFAQVDTVRHIEKQLAEEWERTIRCDFIMLTPPHFDIHWDLEKYTRSNNLPTTKRGRDQELVLKQLSRETIDHYADLLDDRKYEFTDLNIDLVVNRQEGLAYYTGNNGPRTYPLDRLGYHNICRALCRVRAYRRKNNPKQHVC